MLRLRCEFTRKGGAQVIHHVLKPGGMWANLGPLLYHWAYESDTGETPTELSVELPLDEVKALAEKVGFDIIEDSEGEAAYLADCRALYRTSYTCARWVMRKR
jgi:carnosine N-methyltransferase